MGKRGVKNVAKSAGKLWIAKKGLQWTWGLMKIGVVAGAGYFAYKKLSEKSSKMLE